jgi:hypothetical protein
VPDGREKCGALPVLRFEALAASVTERTRASGGRRPEEARHDSANPASAGLLCATAVPAKARGALRPAFFGMRNASAKTV